METSILPTLGFFFDDIELFDFQRHICHEVIQAQSELLDRDKA